MIFLHASDWHLGATEGEYDLLEYQRFFIDEICRIIRERQVDAVLLAGDVYDRSVASAAAIRLYDYAMNRICREFNTKVLTIAGNHDSAERLALSIGMSTVAQKTGVQIEALFIDEGFGTLDDSSIHDAMDILESVRRSSGMIGIISHVQLLENNIPTHLEVIKTNGGSPIVPM